MTRKNVWWLLGALAGSVATIVLVAMWRGRNERVVGTKERVAGTIITNSIGMKFKLIPAGEFLMGSPDSEEHRFSNEGPRHRVRLTKPFCLGMTEVTQGQWERVMGTRPWSGKDYVQEGAAYPATYVSWDDAAEFCRKLSALTAEVTAGRVYRLPTEAEWEYACRGGTTTAYSFGDDASALSDYAWWGACLRNGNCKNEQFAHLVGQKRPNAFGLYDMHGNVWEWCSDWYDGDYYAGAPTDDPTGHSTGLGRVLRGGCWYTSAEHCRSAFRNRDSPGFRSDTLGYLGFRVIFATNDLVNTRPSAYPEGTISDAESAATNEPVNTRPSGVPAESTNSIGMKLKLIPAGKFLMGSPDSEEGGYRWAGPQHLVRLTKPFYLGMTEVTQGQWERVMGTNPSHFCATGGGKDKVSGQDTSRFPVEFVSWGDAMEFCRKLSAMSAEQTAGRVYRLPTEAEWEYACRAGTTSPFSFGTVLNGREANCDGNYPYPYGTATKGPYLERTTTVGSYQPNAFGLYDMHGNVWEWCSDRYDEDYYAGSPTDDPSGPSTASYFRVIRGGSWDFGARYCRSASRDSNLPGRQHRDLGFRVASSTVGGFGR